MKIKYSIGVLMALISGLLLFSSEVRADESFGGEIVQLIDCDCNNVTWIVVNDPKGGSFIRNSSTRRHDCEPMLLGEWILGMATDQTEVCEVTCSMGCCVIGEGNIIDFYGTSPTDCVSGNNNGGGTNSGGGTNDNNVGTNGDEGTNDISVHRFYSPAYKSHFYTSSEAEKRHVIETYPKEVWVYEGTAHPASSQYGNGLQPIYRFWSENDKTHFYTASIEEAGFVVDHYPQEQWRYESIAYYVPRKTVSGSRPVYRFWSEKNKRHFYTKSTAERNFIMIHYSRKEWNYEGIAWYAM